MKGNLSECTPCGHIKGLEVYIHSCQILALVGNEWSAAVLLVKELYAPIQ